ncbi:SusC/RagA family TonB-linked outer membrane protein [Aquimarina sp. RZ0]|uniref:SusC/RagA family TonB-linked outer membrane protein n=1 Tax=Aquimarina sp. RZ0 TaxID=2607730 RepID=UPI0011F2D7EE|nr:SusC/RagA family TonB-linked outer membrane protein [Aquimarina sp. RZ0]KAA1242746.1 SusC/RagA family TonB-linked outer membrane protein [Aquimarina sp. RZ0]
MKLTRQKILILFWVLVTSVSFAQEITIKGKVLDDKGLPLPGVNIVVKNTNNGTQTDFDGKYNIQASKGVMLIYSYLGFEDEEVVVGSNALINISLKPSASELDEVVITALGISKEKKSLGYSVQTIKSNDITEARNTSALNSLSGKIAGIQISTPSGNLGGSSRILLRGPGSITQENRPLIVVDGTPLDNSNFNTVSTQTGGGGRDYGDAGFDINPDDIENISVLKGGAASALYGSRAQNGVILITTKSGKKGKTVITLNSGITFEAINIIPKIQQLYGGGAGNPATFEQSDFQQVVMNGTTFDVVDYATDESWGPRYDPNRLVLHWDAFDPEFPNDFMRPRAWVYPENDREDFFNVGISQNNGVSFTQGTDKSNIRLSLNNTQTNGIVPNSKLDKTSVNFNGSSQLSNKIKINAGVNLTITEGFNRPATGYTGAGVIQQFFHFGQTSLDFGRLRNFKLPDGTQRSWNRTAANDPTIRFSDNPYWTINENIATDERVRWYGNVGLKYDFTPSLYANVKIYGDTYNLKINQQTAVGSAGQSSYSESDRNLKEINYEGRLHYDQVFFDEKININAFIGGNRRNNEFSRISGNTRGGLATPRIYNLNNSVDDANVDEFDSRRRINSIFWSLSIGYDEFAYVTVTGRNDWSSTLPIENNSYFYPSVTGSFVFSKFITPSWLSFGKIRGGIAGVGSDTSPYSLINTFESRSSFFGNIRFNNDETKLNPGLKPEQKTTWEVGLEMAFLKNRVSFDLTYYDEETKDLITPVAVDPSTGFSETNTNAGRLSNKGIEALINITPIDTKGFTWNFTWNFSKNKNELIELIDGVEVLQIGRFPFNGVSVNGVVGQPYGVIRGTNYIFDDQGNRVVGANGRFLETRNVENLGSVLPDYNMGFRNSFNYKGINLGFLIDVQEGGVYRSLTNLWGNYSGILEQTAANNIREEGTVLDAVTGTVTFDADGNYTVTGTSPNTTRITAQQFGQDHFFGPDAQNIFDADYIKLREITLGYTLPKEWIEGNLESVRFTAFARNLFVWGLDNDDIDPEVATSGSGNIQGSEGGALPSTRSFGLNVELKF